ncbi:MAG TPA: M20/M25/M40 family metallo-hydrolase [Candidatus Limnocylindrales bacterium]|nr:M20/M25/M40 family metallo-hydrolase [Candidatus Limnocylindrales bacterium]
MLRMFGGIFALILVCSTSSLGQTRSRSNVLPAQTPHPQQPAAPPVSDLSKLEIEAIGWLQDMLRINTSSPPGNELAAAKYLGSILEKEGIHPELFETAPGRGFLVARLSSSAVPDPSRALLLMGHLDVVGVEKNKWTVDPFGGVIKDGYIYGRGAIDDKGMAVANVAVLIALKRAGVRLNRDVILLAEGDEEAGGQFGMKVAVDKHWDKIAAGFAINEMGRNVQENGKARYLGVQVSEKVATYVDVIAAGTPGHASMPQKDNAVVHLSAAIAKIGAYEAPVQLNSVTRAYFEGLASLQNEETAKWMRALESSDRADHAARLISNASPEWNAMLRDTVAPTMLQAGVRANVIPSEARAIVNIRLLPGNLLAPLVGKLKDLVNDPQVRFDVEPDGAETAPSTSTSTELYAAISRAATQQFPGVTVLPMMTTVATDSVPLRLRNVQAYGVFLFPITEADYRRMHGDDERIPLDSFRQGIEFLDKIVTDFAVAK